MKLSIQEINLLQMLLEITSDRELKLWQDSKKYKQMLGTSNVLNDRNLLLYKVKEFKKQEVTV